MKITKTVSGIAMTALIMVLFSSCCGCRGSKSRTAVSLSGSEWKLTQINGKAVHSESEKYTISFTEDNRIAGMGDCNRIMGGYETMGNGGLKISGAATTRIMCPDQQAEDKFIHNLASIDGYAVEGNILMLTEKGKTTLVFRKK